MKKINHLRVDYQSTDEFCLEQTPDEPIKLFEELFEKYLNLGLQDSNAMGISVIDDKGFPSTRQVLLKEITKDGFIFYTNYTSAKARAIKSDNKVSLNFWWKELGYQVRVNGYAKKIDSKKSENYFHSRPKLSQIAALLSNQSKVLEKRSDLVERFEEYKDKYEFEQVPYPCDWGGFEVKPIYFEFWRGRENRLHDRIIFECNEDIWTKKLLYP